MESQVGPSPGKSLAERHEALSRVSRAVGEYWDPKELFRVLARENFVTLLIRLCGDVSLQRGHAHI